MNIGKNIIALEANPFCFLINYQSTADLKISEVRETVTQFKINILCDAVSYRNVKGTPVNRNCVCCTNHAVNI